MKDIISFDGIKLKMEKDKKMTPFVYASYNSNNARFSIRTGKRIDGQMPQKQSEVIETWIIINQEKLQSAWDES